MSPIIVTFDTSPSGGERAERAGDPEAGAAVPERARGDGKRVERAERDVRDRRVDGDDRGADRPEADVEEDERRDRAQRALVDRRAVERIGMTNSGLTVWSSSRRSTFPSSRWRTTLIEPVVEPAEPPTNMSAKSVSRRSTGHSAKSVVANPVVVMIEIAWNTPSGPPPRPARCRSPRAG